MLFRNNKIGVWGVQGTTKDLINEKENFSFVIVAIGNNKVRLEKSKLLLSQGFSLATLIHPNSTVSKYAEIKAGVAVMAGAVINPFVTVGLSSIVNTSCSIDHDCIIGDGVHISPGVNLAGGISVGDLSWLGIGSSVKQYIEIGSSVTVGAGAVVIEDVPSDSIVKGVPAK